MRKLLTAVLLCLVLSSFGQSFYFPNEYYRDSLALEKSMPLLAKEVISFYNESDKRAYNDNLLRFQIVAELYPEAGNSIDSLREYLKTEDSLKVKGIGFQYQIFAAAKIKQREKNTTFVDAFQPIFTPLFDALPEQAITVVSSYFDIDLKKVRRDFYELLNNQGGKDSIGFGDAKLLCRAYNSYLVYSNIVPLGKSIVNEQENRQFIIEDSVLIKTRDGAKLSATVVRKRGLTIKQPAIFVFNIYNSPQDKAMAKEAADKGYVGVVANTRGKRLSPQEIEPFEHDANDTYDIIDWISKQSWNNGKVGMFGGSYLGFSQWAAAKTVHPALKTIIPQVAVGIGIDYPMDHNVFMSYMLRWIHYVTNSKETDESDFNNEKHWDSTFTKWYVSGKSFRSLDSVEGRPNKIFQRWLMHPSYDSYWQRMVAYKTDFSKINIPVLTTTGYYDADQLGAMYYFKQHHLYNAKANHYLIIGPYDHGGAQRIPSAVLRGYTIDSVANINITNLAYEWFNYILKDSAKPKLLKDFINYQVMGTNKWKHAPSLGKMNNDTMTFHLSNVRNAQHYKLDIQPSPDGEFIRQEVDFKDRSDSIQSGWENLEDSALDVSNGLSFISARVDRAFEINGSFTGKLNFCINKKDMDVSVGLYELLPNGKYFVLDSWQTRCSYNKNSNQRQLLHPGKIVTIPISNSFFVSKKINEGSRLVIVLQIIKSPDWQINYGTGKDVSDETIGDAKIPLQIKWYNSSVVKIPVLK